MAAVAAILVSVFAFACLDDSNQGGNNYQPPQISSQDRSEP